MIQKGVKKKVFRSKSQSSLSFWTTQVFHLFPGIKNLRTKKNLEYSNKGLHLEHEKSKTSQDCAGKYKAKVKKKSLFFLFKAALSNIGSFKKRCIQTYEEIH